MTNKALRILIADREHFHRMKIERLFNRLDYYRVAPVQNLSELLTLVDYGCQSFDVVIINAALAQGALDLAKYFLDCPHVHHTLIYNDRMATSVGSAAGIRSIAAQLPDASEIARLMACVDQPPQLTTADSYHWLRQCQG
ncbi:hypothetical protein GIW70_25900 [Pseudomonas syringae]|nr:hypothetical protein [Pseudomonas syringae]MCF5071603.1 hypothetical protein [Pseudomonas syringae]